MKGIALFHLCYIIFVEASYNMKQNILLTGASGGMGNSVLQTFLEDMIDINLKLVLRKNDHSLKLAEAYKHIDNLSFLWGDLTDYDYVCDAIKDIDIILHVAALVSAVADVNPELSMQVNYGSMKNLLKAIDHLDMNDKIKLVSIGTIAQTGDRMPPVHWGRIGDPIKPSVFDYYAVSKVAAERALVESKLKYWVSLRQTGITGEKMSNISDPIMFHNSLNNVLEYVSDRDSGVMLFNLCKKDREQTLSLTFWENIHNIGGGANSRISTLQLYRKVYGGLGITDLSHVIKPKLYATQNFHGTYYLDSHILNDHLDFQRDSIDYFVDNYNEQFKSITPLSKFICKLPFGKNSWDHSYRRTLIN